MQIVIILFGGGGDTSTLFNGNELCYLLTVNCTDGAKGHLAMFTNKNDLFQLCGPMGDNFTHLLLILLDDPITFFVNIAKSPLALSVWFTVNK